MKTSAFFNTRACLGIFINILVTLGFIPPATANPIPQRLIIIVQEQAWERLSPPVNRKALLDSWSESFQVDLSIVREFGTHGWVIQLEKELPKTELNNFIDKVGQDPNIELIEKDSRMTIQPIRPGLY